MLTLWISFLFGLWILVSGFFPGLIGVWNLIISGIGAALFGFLSFYSNRTMWQGLIVGLIGIWLLISAFAEILLSWNFLLFGLLTAVLGLWGALTSSRKSAESRIE
jgi:hypothetical protein